MKKYNLLKVIGITIFVAWLLTLIVPGSFADYSGAISKGTIKGVGIYQLLSNLSVSISYFNGIAVFLIALACFYSVLGKLDVYNKFVSKTSNLFANKKALLITVTAIVFGILGAVVSDYLILIIFIPFIYKVMKALEVDKKVILSSTIVAGLLGAASSIYNNTLFNIFKLKLNTLLLVKVILLVISLFVLIMFIVPRNKEEKKVGKKSVKKASKKESVKTVKDNKKVNKIVYAILTILLGCIGVNKFYVGKKKEGIISLLFCWTFIPFVLSIVEFIVILTEKADKKGEISVTTEKREYILFIASLIIFVLFVIGAIIPWESLFTKLKVFTNLNTTLSEFKIGSYSVFNNIIGSPLVPSATTGQTTGVINVFGAWAMTDIAILLFILSPVIAFYNKIGINDFIKTITEGIKKILPVAITAMLISIVLVIIVTSGVGVTLVKDILSLAKGFNIMTVTISTIVGGVLTADFYYFLSTLGTVYTTAITNTDYYGALAFIIQAVYNLVMIIAPTSVGIIIGLYYLDIPYNKWIKYIWKLLLILLLLVIVMAIIIYAVL